MGDVGDDRSVIGAIDENRKVEDEKSDVPTGEFRWNMAKTFK